jgi:phosphoribosylformylglycinamidine synthase subunit PurQ / glutaminase
MALHSNPGYTAPMKTAVLVFPGSNCDRDAATAITRVCGQPPAMVWHQETSLPAATDLVVLPGGFSYGDYLRAGAMAARAPVMAAVRAHAGAGRLTLGICNGFQILCETGLLPGVLMRNAQQRFVCRETPLRVETQNSAFTRAYQAGEQIAIPVAHADGRYHADAETLARLEGEGRVALRYLANPNGAANDIAGLLSARGNVMGMMPHPERACDRELGRLGGWGLFESLLLSAQQAA